MDFTPATRLRVPSPSRTGSLHSNPPESEATNPISHKLKSKPSSSSELKSRGNDEENHSDTDSKMGAKTISAAKPPKLKPIIRLWRSEVSKIMRAQADEEAARVEAKQAARARAKPAAGAASNRPARRARAPPLVQTRTRTLRRTPQLNRTETALANSLYVKYMELNKDDPVRLIGTNVVATRSIPKRNFVCRIDGRLLDKTEFDDLADNFANLEYLWRFKASGKYNFFFLDRKGPHMGCYVKFDKNKGNVKAHYFESKSNVYAIFFATEKLMPGDDIFSVLKLPNLLNQLAASNNNTCA